MKGLDEFVSLIGTADWPSTSKYDWPRPDLIRDLAASTAGYSLPICSGVYQPYGPTRKWGGLDTTVLIYTSYFAYVATQLAYTHNATSGVKRSCVYLEDQLHFRIDSGSSTVDFYATDLSNSVRLIWSYSASGKGCAVVQLKRRYKPFDEPPTSPHLRSTNSRFRYAEQSHSLPKALCAVDAANAPGSRAVHVQRPARRVLGQASTLGFARR
jgi:hypothetical protein